MRKITASLILISVFSCKKENSTITQNHNNDSISTNKNTKDRITENKQSAVFNFQTFACDNEGIYDPSKYTKEELEGTLKLYNRDGLANLPINAVFRIDGLQETRNNKNNLLTELDQKYNELKSELKNAKVVNIPYWQEIKNKTLQSLDDSYEKDRTILLAYSDPKALLNSKFSSKCNQFALALNGDDNQLEKIWRNYIIQKSKTNANPEEMLKELENKINSSQKREYATIDLINGWSNCANHTIEHPQSDEKMNNEFKKLFIKIEEDCDEP